MSGVGGPLAFVMFIGAARADANPEQLAQLRTKLPPLLGHFQQDGNARPVLEAVLDVMGPQWCPSREWQEWIVAMLAESQPSGSEETTT